jgi:hypothetical protein
MRTSLPTRLAAAALVAGLALAGCGSDDDSADPAPQETTDTGAASDDTSTDDTSTDDTSTDDAGTDSGSTDSGDGGSMSSGDGIAEAIGGEGTEDALDAVGLEGKGDALVTATKADRFEVEDGVLHLYLNDGSSVPEGTECIIAGSVLSDGEQAVIHRADGTEVPCP